MLPLQRGQRDQDADHGYEHDGVGRAPAWRFTFATRSDPGIAPSRLNAKVIRDALVRQAVVQKSCPAVEIRRIRKCQSSGSAWPKITSTAAEALSVTPCVVLHGEQERQEQQDYPPMAE